MSSDQFQLPFSIVWVSFHNYFLLFFSTTTTHIDDWPPAVPNRKYIMIAIIDFCWATSTGFATITLFQTMPGSELASFRTVFMIRTRIILINWRVFRINRLSTFTTGFFFCCFIKVLWPIFNFFSFITRMLLVILWVAEVFPTELANS